MNKRHRGRGRGQSFRIEVGASACQKIKIKKVGAFVFGLQQKSGWRNPTLQNGMNYRDIDREGLTRSGVVGMEPHKKF
jgi:hypothetical protein